MNERELHQALSDLPLGGIRYFDRISSTNDTALVWATEGAADLSLVIADEQTAGRGRLGRHWYTPPGTALAFSLILRPTPEEQRHPSLITGLGALSLVQVIQRSFGLIAQIKWPNDVLLQGRKVAGILVESVWLGEEIESITLGMGVNVHAAAVPPEEQLGFPATSLEEALGKPPDRLVLLHDILAALIEWRAHLGTGEFIQTWESSLAYRGEQVQVWIDKKTPVTGHLLGIEPDGSLRFRSPAGKPLTVRFGDVHLRPIGVEYPKGL